MKKILLLCFICNLFNYALAQTNVPVAKIPFELEGEHIFIRLNIEGSSELDFVFDTGAGSTVINSELVKRLNWESDKTTSLDGASGETELRKFNNKDIILQSLTLTKVDLLSTSLNHFEESFGRHIDGIIGYDFLKKYVIEINYNTFELIVFNSKKYRHHGIGAMKKIFIGDVPTTMLDIKLSDDTYIKGEFILDTGAGLTVAFATPFINKNDLKAAAGKTYSLSSQGGLSKTNSQVEIGKIKALKIMDEELKNLPVRFYNTTSGVLAQKGIAGLIGNEILKRYNITFDYKRKKSYWVANNRFLSHPFDESLSGIMLNLNKDKSKVIVSNLIPGFPVTKTELKLGDEIIEIDGYKTSNTKLTKLRKLLKQKGKTISIKYIQEKQIKEIFLELKPII